MKLLIKNYLYLGIVLLVLVLGTVGYLSLNAGAPTAAADPTGAPLPQVGVKTLNLSRTLVWSEYSGKLNAVGYAEIRPEVGGRITEVRFKDGQIVKEGDILFVIEPRPFQDAVDRDSAAVSSTQAKMILAQIKQKRMQNLFGTEAIAQQDLDEANCNAQVAEADYHDAQATLKQAQVDLEHAYVTAPISGRTSRAEITVGNVVQSGPNAPVLTSIVSRDGIYADFDVDESTYLNAIRRTALNPAAEQQIPVELVLPDDANHVYKGFIQNFDNKIDNTSGTIRARAKFANEDGALAPGMFVSVRIAQSSSAPVLLVPENALAFDQDKKYVDVVDRNNRVSYREVVLGSQVGDSRVVLSGLQAGDRVIVEGLQRVRPNDLVDAQEVREDPVVATNQLDSAPQN